MTSASLPVVPATRPSSERRRDLSVDSLRGLAVILMVAGHVIGGTGEVGMRVGEESGWRHFYRLLDDLRMPLFTALSGFVYALRPIDDIRGYGPFVWGKVRRLLMPLLTVGTAFVVLQALTPGTNAGGDVRDLWRVYVYGGPGHFWFLQAIFLIFLLVGMLDTAGVWRSPRRVVAAVILTGSVSVLVQVPPGADIFSVDGALRLLPFFLMGYGLSRFGFTSIPALRVAWLVCTAALLALRAYEVLGDYALVGALDRTLGLLLGITGITALLTWRHIVTVNALARLGYFSFAIYLLHVFGTAPTRMVLGAAGVEWDVIVFALCLTAGLALPVVFETTLGRVGVISRAALGQRAYVGRNWR